MTEPNPKADAFFANATDWRQELAALRAVLLGCPVIEDFKWRSPCYTFQGGNIATLWGFKENCVLGFFKGILLDDPAGILVAPGENSRSVRMVKFTSLAEIQQMATTLQAYVQNAINVEAAGLKVAFPKGDLGYPAELITKLEEDPEFQAAFEALTPGRRRGYLLYFSQPKHAATRIARIEKYAQRILGGKGINDR